MDSTRAISEGTGEKDTKKALEFRRKEVSWKRCNDFVFLWFMNLSLSKGTLQEFDSIRIARHSKGLYVTLMKEP